MRDDRLSPVVESAKRQEKRLTIFLSVLAALTLVALGAKIAGVKMYAVTSPSMEPALEVGSLIVVLPQKFDRFQTGDIVTYYINPSLQTATHRIVGVDNQKQIFMTKGDNNEQADAPVLYGNTVGKVVFSVPHGGYALAYLSTLPGKLTAGLMLAAFVLFLFRGEKKVETATEAEESGRRDLDGEEI